MKPRYHPAFLEDLIEAARWYEQRQAGLGEAFIQEAEDTIDQIARQPSLWRVVGGGVRRVLLKRFPFAIHYRFIEEAGMIRFLTIKHGARHPDYGQDRR